MTAKDIAAIIVEAGIIPPCDEQDAVEKLDGYGFVDDDLAECLEACEAICDQFDGTPDGDMYAVDMARKVIAKAKRRFR